MHIISLIVFYAVFLIVLTILVLMMFAGAKKAERIEKERKNCMMKRQEDSLVTTEPSLTGKTNETSQTYENMSIHQNHIMEQYIPKPHELEGD